MRRMILPILKKYWKLLLSALIVSALGCGIMVGMSGAYVSLDRSLESYVSSYNYPHAFITTEVVNRSRIEALSALDGVTAVNARLCGDTVMIDERDRYLSVRVFSYNDDDLQRFHYWSTADCGEREAVMLEYNFAEDNGIHAGDEVRFRVGEEYRSYLVSAIVSAPETLSVQISDDSWGVNTDFGFAYAHVSLVEKESEKEYNKAKNELDSREGELDDAQREADSAFADAKSELDAAKAQLDEKDALFESAQLEAAEQKQKLLDTAENLRRTRAELEKNIADLNAARPQLVSGSAQLAELISSLEQAKAALNQIDSSLAQLTGYYNQLTDPQVVSAVNLMRTLPQDVLLDDIFAAVDELNAFIELARQNGFTFDENAPLSQLLPELLLFINMVESDYAYLNSAEVRALIARAENGEDISGDPGYARLVMVIMRYDDTLQNGGDIVTAYHNANARVTQIHNRIQSGNIYEMILLLQLLGGNVTLGTLQSSVARLRFVVTLLRTQGYQINTVGDLVTAYDNAVSTLSANIAQLNSQRSAIVAELERQGVRENEIDSKLAELRRQKADIDAQIAAIPDTLRQLNDGIREIDSALVEISDGIEKIDEELADAKEQLDKAHEEYAKGEAEYNSSLADAMSEFASLRDELKKAFAQLDDEEGYEALANQFMLYFDDNADHAALLKTCEAALGDVAIKKSFIYEDSAVKNRIDINLAPIDTMSTFMPMVFFVVILIVVFLFMSLVIRQCRREIGILRALGFSSGSIRLLYCGVDLVVSLLAIILGTALGYGVMRYVGYYYQDFFPLPEFSYSINVSTLLLAAALTIIVGQAATLIGTTVISKIHPSEAMTRPAPVTAKLPKFIQALTKKSTPMVKFSISSMLRNKGRFAFSVICVAASVMMIFSSLAFITSKNHILRQLYDERIHYDCQIFFDEQPDEKTLAEFRALPFVSDVQPLIYYESDVAFNGRTEQAVVNAVDEGTELISVYDSRGNMLALPEDGIILEAHLAKRLGAKVGDTVTVDGVPFEIRSISEQSVSRFQYISTESAENLKQASLGGFILNVAEADEQRLLAKLTETDGYLYSVFTRLSYLGNAKVFRTYDLATSVIIGFAILIGLTIVYNTTQTNLLERKKELCVLRTLGFQRSSISRSWFVQSLLQFVCSLAVGLPVGIYIAKLALNKISTEGREYVFANGPKEYLFTALLVFGYIVISHILAMRSLKKWNIVETVKEKE